MGLSDEEIINVFETAFDVLEPSRKVSRAEIRYRIKYPPDSYTKDGAYALKYPPRLMDEKNGNLGLKERLRIVKKLKKITEEAGGVTNRYLAYELRQTGMSYREIGHMIKRSHGVAREGILKVERQIRGYTLKPSYKAAYLPEDLDVYREFVNHVSDINMRE